MSKQERFITTKVCSLRYLGKKPRDFCSKRPRDFCQDYELVEKRPRDFCNSQISLGLLQISLGLFTNISRPFAE